MAAPGRFRSSAGEAEQRGRNWLESSHARKRGRAEAEPPRAPRWSATSPARKLKACPCLLERGPEGRTRRPAEWPCQVSGSPPPKQASRTNCARPVVRALRVLHRRNGALRRARLSQGVHTMALLHSLESLDSGALRAGGPASSCAMEAVVFPLAQTAPARGVHGSPRPTGGRRTRRQTPTSLSQKWAACHRNPNNQRRCIPTARHDQPRNRGTGGVLGFLHELGAADVDERLKHADGKRRTTRPGRQTAYGLHRRRGSGLHVLAHPREAGGGRSSRVARAIRRLAAQTGHAAVLGLPAWPAATPINEKYKNSRGIGRAVVLRSVVRR